MHRLSNVSMSNCAWTIAVSALFAGVLFAGELNGDPLDSITNLRSRIERVAVPVYHSWLQTQLDHDLRQFGFSSRSAAESAQLLPAIPVVIPRQDRGPLSRFEIETSLERIPLSWIVPVSVSGKIVALLTVDTLPGTEPEVVAYGKPFAANRLNAGIRALGLPRAWEDLRIVSFTGPRIDLLVARKADGTWSWWHLSGTDHATAAQLDGRKLQTIFDSVTTTDRGVM